MEEQLIGIADILDIEQFDLRIRLGVEVLVHILQHILDADLFAVADTPDTIELQPLDDRTLQNEYCCGTRAADKVGTLGIEIWNGQGEHAMVVAIQETDAVRTDEGSPILFAGVEDALFEFGSRLRLLAETGRDNDEGACLFLLCQEFHVVGTETGSHDQNCQVGGRQVMGIVEGLDTLHFIFLGVYNAQGSIVSSTQQITYDRATWLMHVIGAADDDNAPGV